MRRELNSAATLDRIDASFDAQAPERWTQPTEFLVDPDLCRRYAAATNDAVPAHRSGASAPPLLGVVATVPHVHVVLQRNLPPEVLNGNRSVHGEHDIVYHAPLVPGTTLLVRGRVFGIHPRSTGTAFVTRVEIADRDGRVVQEQYFVNFLRAVMTDSSIGQDAAPHRLGDVEQLGAPDASVDYRIDPDQTYRYAEASGDRSIYHLDDAAARAAGFPGIIVHGLCTMAFAGRALVEHACPEDPSRLRRLAVRFSRPLYPGQTMTTTMWDAPAAGGAGTYRFLARSDIDETVLTDGLAAVEPVI